jgi:hypothetical protein
MSHRDTSAQTFSFLPHLRVPSGLIHLPMSNELLDNRGECQASSCDCGGFIISVNGAPQLVSHVLDGPFQSLIFIVYRFQQRLPSSVHAHTSGGSTP